MNQENELASVKRKIRALFSKTTENGASEAEAMAAMEKAGELLLQYNLSMDEITLREQKCITGKFETGSKHLGVLAQTHSGLSKLCGVRTWYQRSNNGIVWNFFGLEPDVDMAIYLCTIISVSAEVSFKKFKFSTEYKNFSKHKKIAANNFKNGFGERINVRLVELAKEKEHKEKEAANYHAEQMKSRMLSADDSAIAAACEQKTGTALITLTKSKMIEEEMKKRNIRLVRGSRYPSGQYNSTTRAAGAEAANSVNLSRPVGNSTSSFGGYLK